jgi:hypothetical protein
MLVPKRKPAAAFRYGQRVRNLCCDPLLLSYSFELRNQIASAPPGANDDWHDGANGGHDGF